MINAATGEFGLDDYDLVINPDLSLSDFKSGGLPIQSARFDDTTGFTICCFVGLINGLKAQFRIYFQGEHLHELRFEREEQQLLWERLHKETVAASKDGPDAAMAAASK